MTYIYTVEGLPGSRKLTYPSAHTVKSLFLWWESLRFVLSSSQVYNNILLAIVTMLYTRSSELTVLRTEGFVPFKLYLPMSPSPNILAIYSVLSFYYLAFCCCCHSCVCVCAQACLILCDPMDCNPPGSSVHGIFQARILQQVVISSPRNLANPGIKLEFLVSLAMQANSLLLSQQRIIVYI